MKLVHLKYTKLITLPPPNYPTLDLISFTDFSRSVAITEDQHLKTANDIKEEITLTLFPPTFLINFFSLPQSVAS